MVVKGKRKISKRLVILYGVCSALWVITSILRIYEGGRDFSFWLYLFCAGAWTSMFGVMLRRYLKQQEEEEGGSNDEQI